MLNTLYASFYVTLTSTDDKNTTFREEGVDAAAPGNTLGAPVLQRLHSSSKPASLPSSGGSNHVVSDQRHRAPVSGIRPDPQAQHYHCPSNHTECWPSHTTFSFFSPTVT